VKQPAVFVYGGTIKPGHVDGKDIESGAAARADEAAR
jgi:dihydroxyacid dehydratase/phosphogluconate dehydratase